MRTVGFRYRFNSSYECRVSARRSEKLWRADAFNVDIWFTVAIVSSLSLNLSCIEKHLGEKSRCFLLITKRRYLSSLIRIVTVDVSAMLSESNLRGCLARLFLWNEMFNYDIVFLYNSCKSLSQIFCDNLIEGMNWFRRMVGISNEACRGCILHP